MKTFWIVTVFAALALMVVLIGGYVHAQTVYTSPSPSPIESPVVSPSPTTPSGAPSTGFGNYR